MVTRLPAIFVVLCFALQLQAAQPSLALASQPAVPDAQGLANWGSGAPVLPLDAAAYKWVSIAGGAMERSGSFEPSGCAGASTDPRHRNRAGLSLPDGAVVKWIYVGFYNSDSGVGGGTATLHSFAGDGPGTEVATLQTPPGSSVTGYGWVAAQTDHTVDNSTNSYAVGYVAGNDAWGGLQGVCYVRIGYIAPGPFAVALPMVHKP